jgi:hypothetical protein
MPVFLSYQRDAQGERRFLKKSPGHHEGQRLDGSAQQSVMATKKELSSSLSAYAVKSTHGV